MADPSEPSGRERDPEEGDEPAAGDGESVASETLRERVEADYDFENFSPADMAEMSVEEWEAAFDADSWITGQALVDRVEADLRSRVATREVFAVVERIERDGVEHVLAYNDAGYALVSPEGEVEGEGAILRDVEPVVALCSMESYDVGEPPADAGLPDPAEVTPGGGGLGHRLLLVLAVVQVVAGVVLLVSPLVFGGGSGSALLTTVAGLGFLVVGVLLGVLVANARLSDRFRAEEYRGRLRAAGVGSDERPAFLPTEAGGAGDDEELAEDGAGSVDGRSEGVDEPAGDGRESGPD